MREIKFRGWDKERKYMFYDAVAVVFVEYEDKGIIMQYTNLKDKNGKEIYEGDILDINGMLFNRPKDCPYVVDMPYVFYHESLLKLEEREIIGNIYENKELLNT